MVLLAPRTLGHCFLRLGSVLLLLMHPLLALPLPALPLQHWHQQCLLGGLQWSSGWVGLLLLLLMLTLMQQCLSVG